MWAPAHLTLLTLICVVTTVMIACGGLYLAVKFPAHPAAGRLTITLVMAITIILSVGLNQFWGAQRDRDRRAWAARSQHHERLRGLLRTEAGSLKDLAQALREGRYFTLVADDARKAVWHDDTLTADVERHFPEYFRDREELIRQILQYDRDLGRIRRIVSAALPLTAQTEPYRSELVPALVRKCGGAPGRPFVALAAATSRHGFGADSPGPDQLVSMRDAVRTYEDYRCTADLTRMCQGVLDRAADLADAALLASEDARRYAEEMELHGSCTYAPAE